MSGISWLKSTKSGIKVEFLFIVTGILILAWVISSLFPFTKGGAVIDDLRNKSELLATSGEPYLVSVRMESLDEVSQYLEVYTKDGSYTEIPINDEGDYMLYDWLTSDGKYYTLLEYEEEPLWCTYPDTFNLVGSRQFLFLDKLLKGATSIEEPVKESLDLGYREMVEADVYTFQIPSGNIKKVLGLDSLEMYNVVLTEAGKRKDSELLEALNPLVRDTDNVLTVSNGVLKIGVHEGLVKYTVLEVGGLGQTITITRTVHSPDELTLRELPSFTENNVVSVYDVVREHVLTEEDKDATEGDSAGGVTEDLVVDESEEGE